MTAWVSLLHEWRAAGRPADLPPVELALLRLIDASENGWREREQLLHDAELRACAVTLIDLLRRGDSRVYLDDAGRLMVGSGMFRDQFREEITALRDVIVGVLKAE